MEDGCSTMVLINKCSDRLDGLDNSKWCEELTVLKRSSNYGCQQKRSPKYGCPKLDISWGVADREQQGGLARWRPTPA